VPGARRTARPGTQAPGLGDVPDPDVPELWSHDITGGVVDLSTGRGIALDQQADEP